MNTLFLLLFLFSFALLVAGLIKPAFVIRWGGNQTRKIAAIIFGSAFLVFFVLFGLTVEPTQKSPQAEVPSQTAPETQKPILNEQTTEPPATPAPVSQKQAPTSLYKTTYIVDGDTIEIETGERVRLIGIDSPERGQPYYSEARSKLAELIQNKTVRLEKDITDKDKYGRLLRYIYFGDLFINVEIVRLGFANSYTYPPDVKYQSQILSAEQEARNTKVGLWAPQLESAPQPSPSPQPQPAQSVICSYNAYSCTDFKTHAEAQSVYEQCGGVNNDAHKLDQDKDGLACEGLP